MNSFKILIPWRHFKDQMSENLGTIIIFADIIFCLSANVIYCIKVGR